MIDDAYFSLVTFNESWNTTDNSFVNREIQINLISKELSVSNTKYIMLNVPAIEGKRWYTINQKVIESKISKNGYKINNAMSNHRWQLLPTSEIKEEPLDSIGVKLSDEQVNKILPFCKVKDFEPYRERTMFMKDPGYIGYRDILSMEFLNHTRQ